MTRRTTIYLPEDLSLKIRTSALHQGQTLSAWMERAAQAHLKELKAEAATAAVRAELARQVGKRIATGRGERA